MHRGDDLLSLILSADVDGEALSPLDTDFFFMLLMNAGSETTRNLITGGMLALFEHPEQRARLQGDLDAAPDRDRRDAALGDAGDALPSNRAYRRGARR